jgi:SAM-dependent methyltransferase
MNNTPSPPGHPLAKDKKSYLSPTCEGKALDLYVIRAGILQALRNNLHHFSGEVLDVGCGYQPYRSLLEHAPARITRYIGLDLDQGLYDAKPEATWDGKSIPFPAATFDSTLATEVLEHCPEPQSLLNEIARVLKPGGFFFLTVPFMWPLHDMPYDEYRYTPSALTRLLTNAGFADIAITAHGGWDASLAQMIGLWVRGRPMAEWKRKVLTFFATPVVGYLSNRDRAPTWFNQQIMVPGFAASARKAVAVD